MSPRTDPPPVCDASARVTSAGPTEGELVRCILPAGHAQADLVAVHRSVDSTGAPCQWPVKAPA